MSRTYEQLEPVISALDERISANASQIDGLPENVTELNERLLTKEADLSAIQDAGKYSYTISGFINTSGAIATNDQYRSTDYIACNKDTSILLKDIYTGESVLAYAFYKADKTFISGQNNIQEDAVGNITIPTNAAYVRFSGRITDGITTTWTPIAFVYTFKGLFEEIDRNKDSISNLSQTFDLFKSAYIYPYTTGKFINVNGNEAVNTQYALTDYIICDTASYIYIHDIRAGSSSLAYAFYTKDKVFISGQNSILGDVTVSVIPSNAKYIRASSRIDDGAGETHDPSITVYNNKAINAKVKELDQSVTQLDALHDLNILVFGDSISDTQNITINASNETTAYSEKTPNNSYIKDGQTIKYSMWPSLIQRVLDIKEMRNYAKSGSHFYTTSSTPADPRQKLLYQVQVALNDLDNPNNVFPTTGDFVPDIVIVACGINDGNIQPGAFETAMSKTVMNQAGTGVDVEATMAALDQRSPIEAMRYVLMLLKQTFPTALFLYVNPLQQTYSTTSARLTARTELGKMAEQYNFINLDGFGQFGVVRDFETQSQIGLLTKDGLHPNEKGQNLYARNIVQAIRRYYFPLDQFNT